MTTRVHGPIALRALDAGELHRAARWHEVEDLRAAFGMPAGGAAAAERWLLWQTARGRTYFEVDAGPGGEPIGLAALSVAPGLPPDVGTISYGIAPGWRGRGCGGEAARALVAHAVESLGVRELRAIVRAENAASRRIVERLGFQRWGGEDTRLTYRWLRG